MELGLKGKVAVLEFLSEILVLIKFVTVDRDFHSSYRFLSPNKVSNFDIVLKPCIWFYKLLIDVAHSIKRTRADRIGVRTVDLSFVAVGERGRTRRSKVKPRVPFVIDLDLGSIAEILV